jgi:hypothetical protein
MRTAVPTVDHFAGMLDHFTGTADHFTGKSSNKRDEENEMMDTR